MGVLVLMQGDEQAGVRFGVKVLNAIMAVLVWIFSVCLFFSQWQLQGATAGLPLFILIVASNSKNDLRFAGWIATGLYIFAFWYLAGAQFGNPVSSKFKRVPGLQDCSDYFDGYFQFDSAMYNIGAGAGNVGADPVPWNQNMKGTHATGNPSRYHGYCKGNWQAANTFMFAFFFVAAFTNLAGVTAAIICDGSGSSEEEKVAPAENQPDNEQKGTMEDPDPEQSK
jgi:hypothetical protein